ncbi:MAG TPA: hypothetical protein VGN24_05935, partial [Rhodanobacter sp.]|nr:hypothetical protein [Rhodanobacter sp.]
MQKNLLLVTFVAVTAGLILHGSAAVAQHAPHSASAEIEAAMAWLHPPEPPSSASAAPPDDRILLHV